MTTQWVASLNCQEKPDVRPVKTASTKSYSRVLQRSINWLMILAPEIAGPLCRSTKAERKLEESWKRAGRKKIYG
jgi:hypothetical protein